MKEKREFKSNVQLKSNFNMTQLDFERVDKIIIEIEEHYKKCVRKKWKSVSLYLSSLRLLYKYIRPLLNEKERDDFDKQFNSLFKQNDGNDKFEGAMEMEDSLMLKRQYMGMGIFATKEKRIAEKHLKEDL